MIKMKRREYFMEDNDEKKESKSSIKLDYTLKTPEERSSFVQNLIENTPPEQFNEKYIEILTDYIIFAMDKKERKERNILTENRMVTINKRETSYQGLAEKFENGEDGVSNLIHEDKNTILTPKVSITEQDIAEIKPLQDLKEAIEVVRNQEKVATGKRKFLLKKQIIEMCQQQYAIKSEYKSPIYSSNTIKGFVKSDLNDKISINTNGEPQNDGAVSFFNPKHLSALLCNYSALKEEAYGNFINDAYYMMEDLDNLIEETLKDNYPLYYDLLIYKIDGRQNVEIQLLIESKYGIKHSVEYISSLWRNKIPKLLAEQAKKDYLMHYYTNIEYGKWKKCSKCGEIKLAHNYFFSINKTSKDGYYSICKACRNQKNKQKE
jgi:hypothetical protein